MTAWVKIAFRNLTKNRRRSVITALAIALGFASVSLSAGFMKYMYKGNREVAIYADFQGHLSVFKKGFLEKGKLDPARYILSREEIKTIREICLKTPGVILATPQLRISGIVTNGSISTVFIAQGITPSVIDMFLNRISMTTVKNKGEGIKGRKLDDEKIYGVGMARGLARLLALKTGSTAVAFTSTLKGQMNALDLEVFNLFDASSSAMNDKFMIVPFRFAQKLYDTQGADRITVLLSQTKRTGAIRDRLETAFAAQGLDVEVKTWEEMSRWYRNVKDMFDIIFLFLFIIVFFIVITSVMNTMGMTVIERTREIGTLRALGLKRKGVVLLFAVESVLLGIFGSIAGFFLTVLIQGLTGVLKPTWIPPSMTSRVVIQIEYLPGAMTYIFFFLLLLCLTASLVPARRAARRNIVDALGHV